jgi:pimeloyl-ACP methyl ester carboxylesterase
MSLKKTLINLVSNLIPSPITVDFDNKSNDHKVQKVAPYPKGVWDDSVPILKSKNGIEYVQTPAERFQNLEGYPFQPNYIEIDGLKMHYVDEGPRDGEVILLLHGQPTWSYLYRKMITPLVAKGYRCIAPDLIGMGKSDKPIHEAYHTFDQHCENILAFIQKMNLKDINAFVQDWGSLIGLRLVGENSHLFKRVVLANGDLPLYEKGENPLYVPNPIVVDPKVKSLKMAMAKNAGKGFAASFQAWILYCLKTTQLFAADVVSMMTVSTLTPEIKKGYDAPFPSFIYNAGPRTLPAMSAGILGQNQSAWDNLKKFEKPFLSIIGTKDRLLGRRSIQKKWVNAVPGAKGQKHEQYPTGHHFIQEDLGEILANRMDEFIQKNPA